MAIKNILLVGVLGLLLMSCSGATAPRYEQTEGSRAAFAFADRLLAGESGNLAAKAREAGLVRLGVCRELGRDRLYCNALRLYDIGLIGVVGFPGESAFGAEFDELRLCLKGTDAIGYIASGGAADVPVVLFDEYPAEYKTLLEHAEINVSSDLRGVFEDGTVRDSIATFVTQVFGGIDQVTTLRRLGLGPGMGHFSDKPRQGTYLAASYPPHAITISQCQR